MVPKKTPCITKNKKNPPEAKAFVRPFFHVLFQSRYFAPHIHHHLGSTKIHCGRRWFFHQQNLQKYGHQIGSFPQIKGWKWKILQTTAQIQVHETVIRRMHPEPPNSCFFPWKIANYQRYAWDLYCVYQAHDHSQLDSFRGKTYRVYACNSQVSKSLKHQFVHSHML